MNPLKDIDAICPKFPKDSSEEKVSACQKYFDHRYVIGIHQATEEVVKKFVTGRGYYRMVSLERCFMWSFFYIGYHLKNYISHVLKTLKSQRISHYLPSDGFFLSV